LQGIVVVPLLIAIKQEEDLNKDYPKSEILLGYLSKRLRYLVLAFFTTKGWLANQMEL